MKEQELHEYLTFARKLAKKAGSIVLKAKKTVVKQKDIQDIATQADLDSESYCIAQIQKKYSNHHIFSEERGDIVGTSSFRWIIDPLDGTKEFVRDIPLFNCAIVLEFEDKPIVSAIYRPTDDVLYSAALNIGAFRNGVPIHASNVDDLSRSFIFSYLPPYDGDDGRYESAWDAYKKVGKSVYRIRSLSDENSVMCWLAQGALEGHLHLGHTIKWHDFAAGSLIAQESGGVVTTIDGEDVTRDTIHAGFIVSNGKIHHKLLGLLA